MRIEDHPVLDFERAEKDKITFYYEDEEIEAYRGETIAAALHAAGVRELKKSLHHDRPRGFFCAIGNCSSCYMIVDGRRNVKTCVTRVEEGMVVEEQRENRGDSR
ncbi:(2Fe-2S)-binding protein [Halarsenatibacter silvermanii]|uniref:2Fe-2S iron-sulfur cluster binding domain-containing protein n=1 Tax=Halarsenatibacter silvermanii TaxID=321763 RepID=A0A1G9H1H6_9FIRM|nr:(2Fe-2S)-binding protein [Halarsenatibacter silvermanii]SDL06393.1 2Fe-2S iron-sulfur cluster binding domain-containing protein [Halarsenatibacter silvermanii]